MRWVCSISSSADHAAAVDEIAEEISRRLDGARPDLLCAFATPSHAEHYARVSELLRQRLQPGALIGCSGPGVLADGIEVEQGAGLAVAAAILPDVSCRVFAVDGDEVPEDDDLDGWWSHRLDASLSDASGVVLIPEPGSVEVPAMLEQLDTTHPGIAKVGGLVSGGGRPGQPVLYADDRVLHSGMVGVALGGNVDVRTIVAQGCRPIGDPMFVTRAEGCVIQELDGRSPAKVLQTLYEGLDTHDRALMRHSLFLGLTVREHQQVYQLGDFVVRNIVGLDTRNGSMAVGGPTRRNMVVQFHLREAKTATDELTALLQPERGKHDGALLFSCLGRGKALYDEPNHDSRILRELLGNIGLAGFFCAGEIGPVGNQTYLHSYTSAFALFCPKA